MGSTQGEKNGSAVDHAFSNDLNLRNKENQQTHTDAEVARAQKYRSIFEITQVHPNQTQPKYFPADAFMPMAELPSEELANELKDLDSWELANRYHEFTHKLRSSKLSRQLSRQLREISAQAILVRAQKVVGSVVRPMEARVSSWSDIPFNAEQPELDLDETLENSPVSLSSILNSSTEEGSVSDLDFWMSYRIHRRQSIILTVDTSLSMTGEKLALTAVALAVVLLEFPDDSIGIVAFENEPRTLKSLDEKVSVQELIERFLDVPAQGYTHLESGIKAALRMVHRPSASRSSKPPSTILLSDGKYTAGRDPSYLAAQFPHLVVLKMGSDRASLELCRELAKRGRGALKEVEELEDLPLVMYTVVKDILRGRSFL